MSQGETALDAVFATIPLAFANASRATTAPCASIRLFSDETAMEMYTVERFRSFTGILSEPCAEKFLYKPFI